MNIYTFRKKLAKIVIFFRYTAHLGLGVLLYLYSITVRSAAPQTTLWGGPGPRIEPGTGDLEARTLTNRPPHLLNCNLLIFMNTF